MKQSHYRPKQVLTVPGGSDSQISKHSTHGCGKVVSPTHRPPLPPGNISGTHFCWRLSRPQVNSAAGSIMSMESSSDTIGNRASDLPACSSVSLTSSYLKTTRNARPIFAWHIHMKILLIFLEQNNTLRERSAPSSLIYSTPSSYRPPIYNTAKLGQRC